MPKIDFKKFKTDHNHYCTITNKIGYDSENDAKPAQLRMIHFTKNSYNVYKCKYCKKYHIGHLKYGN